MAGLDTDIRYIKGVGEQRAKLLAKLGISTLRELVTHFPRDYEDRSVIVPIRDTLLDQTVCVRGMVASPPSLSRVRRGMELVKLRVVDPSGSLEITFFNQSYVRDSLQQGETYIFYGKIGGHLTMRSMVNPVFEREGADNLTGRIVPIYRLTAGLSRNLFMKTMSSGLAACADSFPSFLPEAVRLENSLPTAQFAFENIHFPKDYQTLGSARRRLIFEELFVLAATLQSLRGSRVQSQGIRFGDAEISEFWRGLPFLPTSAQLRTYEDAVQDMCSGLPMNRLVQGDVGSGKTLVAAAAIFFAFKNGYQSALMAPTEILAEQHFATLSGFLGEHGLRIAKLTGSTSAKQKRETLALLECGEIDLVVGTHALISSAVEYKRLALVITDEQHRFGVEQRGALRSKSEHPHVLVMSATPIPRTLALIIYGDLDISIIDELPPGRQRVDTFAVDESMRGRINIFIRRLVGEGRQVFIVCPMIDENDELPESVKSAEKYAQELSESVFPDLKIACIHGRMKAKEKDKLMSAFVSKEFDILVSTTVIEVGVDVPNAALMVVENAERFGLSQLHQLRGRVGRGEHKSYCVLFSESEGETARARLGVMCRTNDGFLISEEDLQLRGPGDFFGSRQHGLPALRIADLCTNMDVLCQAQDAAIRLLEADPQIEHAENAPLRAGVDAFLIARGEGFD